MVTLVLDGDQVVTLTVRFPGHLRERIPRATVINVVLPATDMALNSGSASLEDTGHVLAWLCLELRLNVGKLNLTVRDHRERRLQADRIVIVSERVAVHRAPVSWWWLHYSGVRDECQPIAQ